MFIDASAIVAILGREPGHEEIEKRMAGTDSVLYVSPLVRFEASAALARMKSGSTRPTPDLFRQAIRAVDVFIADLDVEEVVITPEIGSAALEASAAYGKVVGHPADLNFGDCFAYACAKVLDVAMLYKGNDFAKTDLA